MKLHTITITASADCSPDLPLIFCWRYGDPLPDLEQAMQLVVEHIDSIKNPVSKATSATVPMPDPL